MAQMIEEILRFGEWTKTGADFNVLFCELYNYVLPLLIVMFLCRGIYKLLMDLSNDKLRK